MKSANQKLSSLRFVDPTRWRAEIIAAMKLEKGFMIGTARRLTISLRSLSRWINDDAELRIAKRRILKEEEVPS